MINDLNKKDLNQYFINREDVAFAMLFGSQAKGKATKTSDIDIAVYFYPEIRHPIEYEEEVFYKGEDEIWEDLERYLKNDVELIVLNRVPSTIAASALRGNVLAINDWGVYLNFLETITDEADRFMDFIINDYVEKAAFEKRDSIFTFTS